MKRKYLIVGLFSIVLAIGAMCFIGASDDVVYATENSVTAVTPEGVDYIVEKHTNISAYRALENGYYQTPSIQTETTGEWVFAGWYKDAACREAVKKSSGEAYAKFVSADVLSVKCQISTDTTPESDSTLLRCISSVDTLKYSFVGFDLITPTVQKNMESSKVGTRIQVTEDKKSNPCNYSPKVVDTESEYFFSAVETINQADFDEGFLIKPYWITKDGTKVYGVSKYVIINDALNHSAIYVPVKKSTEPTGTFAIDGNLVDLVKHDVDGGYAHLKYNVDSTKLGSVTKLQVTGGDANAPIYYRNLSTKYTGGNAEQSWYTAYSDTTEDEFVIATNADLYGLSKINDTFAGKTIYLCADIEANKGKATEAGWDGTKEGNTSYLWTPIGSATSKFNGTFDGQGHTISGINVQTGSRAGLFNHTGGNSSIGRFDLLNSYIASTGSYSGSIAGCVEGNIHDIRSEAVVKGQTTDGTGGIAGAIGADEVTIEIKDCHFAGNVYSTNLRVAGIVGAQTKNAVARITDCTVSGSVKSDSSWVGGLVGNVTTGEVTISGSSVSNAGQVTGAETTGGLVGYAQGGKVTVDGSSFAGKVTAGWAVGGLVSRVNSAVATVEIKNSSFDGACNLIGSSYAGGLVGLVENGSVSIQGSDSDGYVTSTTGSYVGGLVGNVSSGTVTVKECPSVAATITAHKNGEGQSLSGGIIGNVSNGSISIENSCYGGALTASGYYAGGLVGNVLAGEVTISGSSVNDAGQVTGKETTGGLVGYVQGGKVTIDGSGFAGKVTAGWAVGGLVSRVNNATVEIKNSSFDGTCNLTGSSYAGGIVGHIQSGTVSVQESNSDGTITAASGYYAGGLVGNVLAGTVTIGSSCFNGELTAKETAGGLVGYAQGGTVTIKDNSSFTGKVTANWAIGGLVGRVQKGTVNVQNSSFGKTGELLKCSTYTGGFVGLVYDAGNVSINNSSVEGKLEPGGAYVGGYIGSVGYGTNTPANKVTIKDCSSEADITASAKEGYSYASGIIGNVGGGTISIERSYYDGVLTAAGHYVGGIVGCITTTNTVDIKKCYAADTVKASGSNVGGIVGIIYNSDGGTITMEDCLNKTSVESTGSWVGGLIGRQTVKVPTINLTRCLNMGTVKGAAYVGSIIGQKGDATMTATSVYATNTSTATGTENAHNNVAFGNNASPVTVSMVDLTKITVSNEVSADTIKSTILSGLFGADAIWTIGTTSGSTPELNLNQVK